MEPLAAVRAGVGARVAVYQEVGGQGAAPLERFPALRALKQGGGLDQRWASTLANRSNALLYIDLISEPPHAPFP